MNTDINAATYNDRSVTAVNTIQNNYYTAAYNNDTKKYNYQRTQIIIIALIMNSYTGNSRKHQRQ